MDIWRAKDVLEGVLGLLRPYTTTRGHLRSSSARRIALYCLSEIFRAGATETGIVEDGECLPRAVQPSAYHSLLRAEALRLAQLSPANVPWYLRQQVLLYLAATDRTGRSLLSPLSHGMSKYECLGMFLCGKAGNISDSDFATLAVLTRRCFRPRNAAIRLARKGMSLQRLALVADRDPALALEVIQATPGMDEAVTPRMRSDLCVNRDTRHDGWVSLAQAVLDADNPDNALRNEQGLLGFALAFLAGQQRTPMRAITPSNVLLNMQGDVKVRIVQDGVSPDGSMYIPPAWCPLGQEWRFQLGFLLRFILSEQVDFALRVRPPYWKDDKPIYRVPENHWYQRLHGLFNEQSAFGGDWLPISHWVEQLLSALLAWPGCQVSSFGPVSDAKTLRLKVRRRLRQLDKAQGPSRSVFMLPVAASWPQAGMRDRALRACVVQTVIPTPKEFTATNDLTLSGRDIRRRHRNHLSAALAAVVRMLDLRDTHQNYHGRLDWLILPELSVHPLDVKTHLVPFRASAQDHYSRRVNIPGDPRR